MIVNNIKRIQAGIERRWRNYQKRPAKKYDDFTRVQTHFFHRNDTLTIFDVGAHRGESIERFNLVFPNSTIHSFEADEDNYKAIAQKHGQKPNVKINNFGVGSQNGSAKFFRNLKSDTSSFHALNTESKWLKIRSKQYDVSESEFTQKSYDVLIKPLDQYIEDNAIERINLLKIDTQGYEAEVLKGAEKALQTGKIDMIETELIVGDVYEQSLSFYDIESTLVPYGYRFYAIDTSGDLLCNPTLAFNLIYVRSDLEPHYK